ncbi:MAG: HEAT repeat domain-containing protein [Chloroflexi bacterium]|nr:HEAT repeat domain-containing protein [Chloroflexota bacterium]
MSTQVVNTRPDVQASIDALIADLACADVVRCQKARQSLINIGKPGVSALVKALTNFNAKVRWEAARALGEIGDPSALPAMAGSLEDESADVRWAVAQALASIGRPAPASVLRELSTRPDSVWLREGAGHAIHEISKSGALDQILKPVLSALRGFQPSIEVATAAWTALGELTHQASKTGE